MAAIYDVKRNIVPDWLTGSLMFFGLLSNLILSLISNDIRFIFASIISMAITYTITYMLWKLNMWGGGDVKLFTAIATAIPSGLNISFLNIFPQLSIYPFSFTVVVNSILVSFPFLVVFVMYLIYKNDIFNRNIDLLVNVFNISSLEYIKDSTLNRLIPVKDLKEGMIVNKTYFNDELIIELLDEIEGNLKVYNANGDDFKYYFKSQSAGGITDGEMWQLKILSAQNFIPENISIKVSFPFTPAILFGFIIAVLYGDVMMLFAKNLVLVV